MICSACRDACFTCSLAVRDVSALPSGRQASALMNGKEMVALDLQLVCQSGLGFIPVITLSCFWIIDRDLKRSIDWCCPHVLRHHREAKTETLNFISLHESVFSFSLICKSNANQIHQPVLIIELALTRTHCYTTPLIHYSFVHSFVFPSWLWHLEIGDVFSVAFGVNLQAMVWFGKWCQSFATDPGGS